MITTYLLGYGRMGKRISELAENNGLRITGYNKGETPFENDKAFAESEVVIEFSHPSAAFDNISGVLSSGKPVVSGTTGWLDRWDELESLCQRSKGRFFYASNFSFGANVLFHMNEVLSRMMSGSKDYEPRIEEIHHTGKKDKPSGTAATLADTLVENLTSYKKWSIDGSAEGQIRIDCIREGDVKGIHEVKFSSAIDEISIRHEAYSRDGFALGAIEAAKWLLHQGPGIYGMKDMLGLK